jgi:hypothetical protein
MQNEFEMSLIGEISFFLGLQICQINQGICISQTKYIREMLKRFGMEDFKPVITPMQTSCKLRKVMFQNLQSEAIQVNDLHPTICDNIHTKSVNLILQYI